MNWHLIYDSIINKAISENRKKKRDVYYESHHIIPKCMGGTNDTENLVLLTAKEHFICHRILHILNPNNRKLFLAFQNMCYRISTKDKDRFKPSGRVYSYLRIKAREYAVRGPNHYLYGIESHLHPMYNKKHTEETRNKMKINHADFSGKNNPQYGMTGSKSKNSKKVCQLNINGELIKIWDCFRDVERHLGILHNNITRVCKGTRKSAGGFKWKYIS